MPDWLSNSDIQGRIPELAPPATSDALARLREVHLRPRAERRQNDLMKQLAQGQKSGGDTGGLLDGIL